MNSPAGVDLEHASELRELAAWYREFADRAGDPRIWESRLFFAAELDELAALIEFEHQQGKRADRGNGWCRMN